MAASDQQARDKAVHELGEVVDSITRGEALLDLKPSAILGWPDEGSSDSDLLLF